MLKIFSYSTLDPLINMIMSFMMYLGYYFGIIVRYFGDINRIYFWLQNNDVKYLRV